MNCGFTAVQHRAGSPKRALLTPLTTQQLISHLLPRCPLSVFPPDSIEILYLEGIVTAQTSKSSLIYVDTLNCTDDFFYNSCIAYRNTGTPFFISEELLKQADDKIRISVTVSERASFIFVLPTLKPSQKYFLPVTLTAVLPPRQGRIF